MLFRFAVEVDGPVLRIAFRGELDLACVGLFDAVFDLETDGIEHVVLDLAALTFCDVSGVNGLTGLQSFHRSQGRTAELAGALPHVRRLLALMEEQVRPLSGGAISG